MKDTIVFALGVVALIVSGFLVTGEGNLGSAPGIALYPQPTLENTISWAPATTAVSYTISPAETGSTFYLSASGTTLTLPAVRDELSYKFVVAGALDSANVIIDSAEGDNIEGSLIVAGAVVDCDAEDQINFVTDGENLGDFVEVRSNGTYWFITASNVLTSAKMTCTDPS